MINQSKERDYSSGSMSVHSDVCRGEVMLIKIEHLTPGKMGN